MKSVNPDSRRWPLARLSLSSGEVAYYRNPGDQQPLLMLHGLTDNGLCWLRAATVLAEHFDVILLDARGHGYSSMPWPGVMDNPARDVAELIDKLDLHEPALVGHSVGAMTALACADNYPGLAVKLILEDPPLVEHRNNQPSATQQQLFREQVQSFCDMSQQQLIEMARQQHPAWHEHDLPDWAAAKHQVNPGILAHYQYSNWHKAIAAITIPTLLIHGDNRQGSMVSTTTAGQASTTNSHIECVGIANAGHNVRRENFADYMSAVTAFLGA